jgi:hypothetical protein
MSRSGVIIMLKDFIASQRSVSSCPGIFFGMVMVLWNLTCIPRSRNFFRLSRFLRANRLASENSLENLPILDQMEILFVTAGSDIDMLTYAIPAAIKATKESFQDPLITVIVPSTDVSRCVEIIGSGFNISIKSENDVVDISLRESLKNKFGDRYGWALQQILKIEFVLQSRAKGVLVVDADTLLLNSRNWLLADGRQILTPSDEYNASYYLFLNKYGISSLTPKFTFISHHMLMQPSYAKEMMCVTGWRDISGLVAELVKFQFRDMKSPFSIDYEAYAQYMVNSHPDKILFVKWSNFAVRREKNLNEQIPALTQQLGRNFYSLSLHSYL